MTEDHPGNAPRRVLSREELDRLAQDAQALPVRDFDRLPDGKVEVYTGAFGENDPPKALLVTPLRLYVRKMLPVRRMPLESHLVEYVLKRSGDVDFEVVKSKFIQRPEPIIVAEHFFGQHKHEIVDGNHTFLAVAAAYQIGRRDFDLPEGFEPSVQAYVVPPDVWQDFLASPDQGYAPVNEAALIRRIRAFKSEELRQGAVVKAKTKPPKRRWKGRP